MAPKNTVACFLGFPTSVPLSPFDLDLLFISLSLPDQFLSYSQHFLPHVRPPPVLTMGPLHWPLIYRAQNSCFLLLSSFPTFFPVSTSWYLGVLLYVNSLKCHSISSSSFSTETDNMQVLGFLVFRPSMFLTG